MGRGTGKRLKASEIIFSPSRSGRIEPEKLKEEEKFAAAKKQLAAERPADEISMYGVQIWKNAKGEIHRDGYPAWIYDDNSEAWYQDGKLHRDSGPAVVYANGKKEYFKEGELHRANGPAIEEANGYKEWWQNGKPFRKDSLPVVETAGGDYHWKNEEGLYHRDNDLPAVEKADGGRQWWSHGKLHRDPKLGPAVINCDLETKKNQGELEYWVRGKKVNGPGQE